MAIEDLCGSVLRPYDLSCTTFIKKYYQETVLIPFSYFKNSPSINIAKEGDGGICLYNTSFALKEGYQGIRIKAPKNGNTVAVSVSKTTDDFGKAQYNHKVNILFAGLDEQSKCNLSALDSDLFVVACRQMGTDTIEIVGAAFGLKTNDYDLNPTTTGGATIIELGSHDQALENTLPLIYVAALPGSALADFDANFKNDGQ